VHALNRGRRCRRDSGCRSGGTRSGLRIALQVVGYEGVLGEIVAGDQPCTPEGALTGHGHRFIRREQDAPTGRRRDEHVTLDHGDRADVDWATLGHERRAAHGGDGVGGLDLETVLRGRELGDPMPATSDLLAQAVGTMPGLLGQPLELELGIGVEAGQRTVGVVDLSLARRVGAHAVALMDIRRRRRGHEAARS